MNKVLLIGGSDSCAGAGIQADLKVVTALGVYGTTIVTALTAQNTTGVQDVYPVPPAFVAQQIDSIMEDIGTDVVKTGMLLDKGVVKVVADKIREYGISKVVVDPVILAKGGRPLLDEDALTVLMSALFPLALLVTPNVPEAETLTGVSIRSITDLQEAARRLHEQGARNILVKGGHYTEEVISTSSEPGTKKAEAPQSEVTDLFYDGREFTIFSSPRIPEISVHGGGCILASSIAAGLAKGYSLLEAVRTAREFLFRAMHYPLRIGRGHEVVGPFKL